MEIEEVTKHEARNEREKRNNKPNFEMPDLSDSDETTAV